jgi:hypothetical protein
VEVENWIANTGFGVFDGTTISLDNFGIHKSHTLDQSTRFLGGDQGAGSSHTNGN